MISLKISIRLLISIFPIFCFELINEPINQYLLLHIGSSQTTTFSSNSFSFVSPNEYAASKASVSRFVDGLNRMQGSIGDGLAVIGSNAGGTYK